MIHCYQIRQPVQQKLLFSPEPLGSSELYPPQPFEPFEFGSSRLLISFEMLNVNVGVLGHVDSGKTSLAKVLSTIASTSAFDKNPQSKKRGITLDLGFSSFIVDSAGYPFMPSIRENFEKVQFTLVDCPGHGSLIKTVLCGELPYFRLYPDL